MALVIAKVKVVADEPEPEQSLDCGEHIVKILVPMQGNSGTAA